MNRDLPEIHYTLGKEGGEIWSDFYTIPTSAPNREGAYALLNFLLDPSVNAREAAFHGYPVPDARVDALVSEEMRNDPILHPAAELLSTLEFGAAVTLTDPNRAELIARFKSA
jgi:spermidine/putrescine transport system substrate-binding protein